MLDGCARSAIDECNLLLEDRGVSATLALLVQPCIRVISASRAQPACKCQEASLQELVSILKQYHVAFTTTSRQSHYRPN